MGTKQLGKTDTSTSLSAVWRLTWPQLLMMYAVFILSFTPVWTAGRLGADVQAGLGMATQCTFFLGILCMALTSGATAAISQSMGANLPRRAARYIWATTLISLGLGIAVGAAGWIFAGTLLDVLQIPRDIQPVTREIWRIFMIGLPFQYVYTATGVVFRSTRQVIIPLIVAASIAGAHFLVCTGFGLGLHGLPNLGWHGIAWAGTCAQIAGALANCLLLRKKGYLARDDFPPLRWLKKGLGYLAKVSIPAGFASLLWHSGYLVIFILVASVPVESVAALAGLTAGLKIESLIFIPGMAFNMSAATLVGNCLGARNDAEAKRVSGLLLAVAVVLFSAVAAALWPFRPELAGLLSEDPTTCHYIVSYLSYNLSIAPCSIASTVLGGVMVGAGATRFNMLVFGGTFWALRIPLGYVLGHMLWRDASGVFCAMLISQVVQTCIMLFVFFRASWTRFAMRARQ